jgi:hypothetical protein
LAKAGEKAAAASESETVARPIVVFLSIGGLLAFSETAPRNVTPVRQVETHGLAPCPARDAAPAALCRAPIAAEGLNWLAARLATTRSHRRDWRAIRSHGPRPL